MNKGIKAKIQREKKALESYFGRKIEPDFIKLDQSDWKQIRANGLGLHFIPKVSYKEFPKEDLSPFFFKLIEADTLSESSLNLKPGWVLVEKEAKPAKEKIWLHKNAFFDFWGKVGISARRLCGLNLKVNFPGFNKFRARAGATKMEIENKILPQAEKELELAGLQPFCRLLTYLEYVYLGKNFHNNWGRTRTWEWLEDELADGRSMAAGSKQASTLGADPEDYWSTILGYRIIFELKSVSKK